MTMDDRKVEEIVARVVERLAPALERQAARGPIVPTPPKGGGVCAPNPTEPAWRASIARGDDGTPSKTRAADARYDARGDGTPRAAFGTAGASSGGSSSAIHRGRRGVFDDIDTAVKAARA